MSLGLQSLLYEITDKISAKDDQMLLRRLLRALKNYEEGGCMFAKGDVSAALQKHEDAIKALPMIPETQCIRAVIQGALVSDYAVACRPNDAVAIGKEALDRFGDDPRIGIAHANCLHDMGGAFVNLRRLDDGIEHMEKALKIYETLPDGAEGAARCLRNLGRIKAIRSNNGTKPTS
jgi:tetratricopeptide (TPR) repeat protein